MTKTKLYMYDEETYEFIDEYESNVEAALDNGMHIPYLANNTQQHPDGIRLRGAIYSRVYHGDYVDPKKVYSKLPRGCSRVLTQAEKEFLVEKWDQPIARLAVEMGRPIPSIRREMKRNGTYDERIKLGMNKSGYRYE